MAKVIVCGAGISGLSAAYWMQAKGHDVTVLEKNHRAGGVIESVQDKGYLFERGPNSFLDNGPDTLDLCQELKLENRLLKQSLRDNKRYIFLRGELHEVPTGPGAFFKTSLLTGSAKRHLFLEAFRNANRSPEDESVADFVARRLGDEVLLNLLTPFISGVYAGDPKQLSLQATFSMLYDLEREYGSITRGMLAKALSRKKKNGGDKPKKPRPRNLCSFIEGMSELTDALSARLNGKIRLNTEVKEIQQTDSGFTIHTHSGDSTTETCDAVILALPAYAAANAAKNVLPKSVGYLASIPYNRLVSFGAGFRRDRVPHPCDGFGFLAPRDQNVNILGAIWNSSLFANRAPGGERGFTIFTGGGLDPQAYELSDDELMRRVQTDLRTSMGIESELTHHRITRWEKGIPQYPVGHVKQIQYLRDEMRSVPGLFISGNLIDGVSVNDCIRNSRSTVQEAHLFLNGR